MSSKLWSSSIGKKLVMSLSGLFLIVFLLVHLVANLLFFGGEELYNEMTHFMNTNPIIQIMVPVLALGFVVHIAWATVITLKNQTARPVKYDKQNAAASSTWESRNMYVLGVIVFGVLAFHLSDFWYRIQFTEVPSDYDMVVGSFSKLWVSVLYIVWVIALWFHLRHGFWSAFQTVGLNNQLWIKRWKFVADVYAFIIAVGFISIPLSVLIDKWM